MGAFVIPFTRVAGLGEVPAGTVIEVVCGERLLAVCNVDGELRATSGLCPHAGGPLGQGALHGGTLTCPWHMWQFDSKTGECGFNPAIRIPVYSARVVDGAIEVDFPDA